MSQFISRAPYDDEPDTSPIWRTEAFVGAFGDAFVRDSGLEGGQTCNSMDMVADLLGKLMKDRRDLLSLFGDEDVAKLESIRADLKAGAALDREQLRTSLRVHSAAKRNTVSQDVDNAQTFLLDFVRKLDSLRPGQRLVVPGGWSSPTGGHAVIYTIFCDPSASTSTSTNSAEDLAAAAAAAGTDAPACMYSFCVSNTGDGVNYHPRIDCEYYPKSKHQCAILFRDVPRHRLVEKALWYMLFKMKVTSDSSHGPEMLYEVLLPHLCGNLVYSHVSQHLEQNGHWETIQRSGTCFMRSILTCLRFLLKRDGFSHIQQKQLFVGLRRAFLDIVAANLGGGKRLGPDSANLINESDLKLIEVACNQTARAASKLVAYEARLRRIMSGDPADMAAATAAAREQQSTAAAAAAAAAAADEALPGRVWAAREDQGSIDTLRRRVAAANNNASASASASAGATPRRALALGVAELEALEDLVARILGQARSTLAAFQFKIDRADELRLGRSAGLTLFPGFDLVARASSGTGAPFAGAGSWASRAPDPGPASDARPDPFSNARPVPTPYSAQSFQASLRQCIRQCAELRATSSAAGTLAVLHQIVHAVQCFVVCVPFPRTPFSSSTRTSAAEAAEAAGLKDSAAAHAAKTAAARFARSQDADGAGACADDQAAAAMWQDIDNMATVKYVSAFCDFLLLHGHYPFLQRSAGVVAKGSMCNHGRIR
jgi:hypothetical protein